MNTELTWKNVMYPHAWIGHISEMQELAKSVGYPYFLWNDSVYKTGLVFDNVPTKTNFTKEDVK